MPALVIPFRIDPTGRVAAVQDDVAVAMQHLKLLITTRVGERVFRPRYGTRVYSSMFELFDELLVREIEDDIRNGVSRWAPDIRLTRLLLTPDESTLTIDVGFTLRDVEGMPPVTLRVAIESDGATTETLL
jgi:phage baseplate assembly protein W